MTPSELSQRLADQAETTAQHLVPSGKRKGQHWVAANINGGEGDSFKICLQGNKAGVWKDFADSKPGGDLLDLWAVLRCGEDIGKAIVEVKDYLGVKDERYAFTEPHRKPSKPVDMPEKAKEATVVLSWFKKRGISELTVKAFHVYEEPGVIIFPYEREGKTWMLKYRGSKKKFWTSSDPHKILFGWQALPKDCREVTLTEGECDAMAYHEQMIPAMSIPYGAGNQGKLDWIENEYEHLQRFDTIYISMDMDDAGVATINQLVDRLGRHRCRIVTLPHKDANESHMAGVNLIDCIHASTTLDPKELRPASDYLEDVTREFYPVDEAQIGMTLPWSKVDKVRIRPGETSIWTGINSHGKSLLLDHVMVASIPQCDKWCVASMEMMPGKHLKRVYRQAMGLADLNHDMITDTNDYLSGHLWLFDVRGTAKSKRILEVFEYARRRYGITQFVVDSLAKCGFAEDDYNGQKHFVDKLTDFGKEHSCHVHLVAHARKSDNESHAPGKMDVKGTGALTDMVDNVFSVWRNKPKEEKIGKLMRHDGTMPAIPDDLNTKADAVVSVEKQRNGEWEGKIALWFDHDSQQYLQFQDNPARMYVEQPKKPHSAH